MKIIFFLRWKKMQFGIFQKNNAILDGGNLEVKE